MRVGFPQALAVLSACCLLHSTSAQAYVVRGSGWPTAEVDFQVDASVGTVLENPVATLQEAADAWAQPNVPTLRFNAADNVSRDSKDRENVVAAYSEGWPFDPKLLAATVVVRNSVTGFVSAADIYINAQHHTFGPDTYDLQSTLTHEIGHALDLGDEEHQHEAAMYRRLAPRTIKRAIADDDRKGISEIYQTARFLPQMGCSNAPFKVVLLPAAAVLVVLARRRRRVLGTTMAGLMALLALPDLNASETDAGLQEIEEIARDGVAGAVQGRVVKVEQREVAGAPLPRTVLHLTDARCVAGSCPQGEIEVSMWGGKREDGTRVELADQPVPEVGEEILMWLDQDGRSVQRHGATVGFVGRDLKNQPVVVLGDRFAWKQHRWEDVTEVLQHALRRR